MKVIAKISDAVVLCEVTVGEIGRLKGVSGPYDKEWDKKWVDVGAEHDMASAFRTLDSLRGFDKDQLYYVKQRIDTMNESYQKIVDAYEKLALFDTLKEAGDKE